MLTFSNYFGHNFQSFGESLSNATCKICNILHVSTNKAFIFIIMELLFRIYECLILVTKLGHLASGGCENYTMQSTFLSIHSTEP